MDTAEKNMGGMITKSAGSRLTLLAIPCCSWVLAVVALSTPSWGNGSEWLEIYKDPINPQVIFAEFDYAATTGGTYLLYSRDGGTSWKKVIGPEGIALRKNGAGDVADFMVTSGSAASEKQSRLVITYGSHKLWRAGSDLQWKKYDIPIDFVSKLVGTPDPNIFFAVETKDKTSRLFRTSNAGSSWEKINDKLPFGCFMGCELRMVNTQPQTLITEGLVSRDGGKTWHRVLPEERAGLSSPTTQTSEPPSPVSVAIRAIKEPVEGPTDVVASKTKTATTDDPSLLIDSLSSHDNPHPTPPKTVSPPVEAAKPYSVQFGHHDCKITAMGRDTEVGVIGLVPKGVDLTDDAVTKSILDAAAGYGNANCSPERHLSNAYRISNVRLCREGMTLQQCADSFDRIGLVSATGSKGNWPDYNYKNRAKDERLLVEKESKRIQAVLDQKKRIAKVAEPQPKDPVSLSSVKFDLIYCSKQRTRGDMFSSPSPPFASIIGYVPASIDIIDKYQTQRILDKGKFFAVQQCLTEQPMEEVIIMLCPAGTPKEDCLNGANRDLGPPILVYAKGDPEGQNWRVYKNRPLEAKLETERASAQKAREKAQSDQKKKAFEDFTKRFKVESWPDLDQLNVNPFVHEGKNVALHAVFEMMLSPSEGIFAQPLIPFLVSDLPKGLFTTRTEVVVVGKLVGRKDTNVPGREKMSLVHLRFVGAHVCSQDLCRDLLPQ